MLSMLEDSALVLAAQKGDRQAFDELVRRHRQALVAYLCRYRMNLEDAMDLAQDVFVRAWKSLDKFRGDASFKTWLFKIGIRAMLDHKRREKPQSLAADELPLACPAQTPQQASQQNMIWESIQQAMEVLSPRQHHVLQLKLLSGLTFEEMSGVLDSPVGTLKATYFQAIQKLRASLPSEGTVLSQGV